MHGNAAACVYIVCELSYTADEGPYGSKTLCDSKQLNYVRSTTHYGQTPPPTKTTI